MGNHVQQTPHRTATGAIPPGKAPLLRRLLLAALIILCLAALWATAAAAQSYDLKIYKLNTGQAEAGGSRPLADRTAPA